jgi:hypothetical protein
VLLVHSENNVQISVQFTSGCVVRVVEEKRAVVCACDSVAPGLDFNGTRTHGVNTCSDARRCDVD